MYQLNFQLQEATRLAQNKDIEMIEGASISISNHITFLILKHLSSYKKQRITLTKKFTGIRLQLSRFIYQLPIMIEY